MTSPRSLRITAGALLLMLAAIYLLGEAWAVAGWQGRPYRWSVDAISDLGVPGEQQGDAGSARSTRHAVMNATLISSGIRISAAGLVLAPLLTRAGRWVVLPCVLLHGLGGVIVGLYPTGPGATMHAIGALLAIVGGSAMLTAVSWAAWRRYRGFAMATAVCALLSWAGIAAIASSIGDFGLVERIAVDAVIVWEIATGCALLVAARRGLLD